jgi:spermidine synthase
LLNTIVDRKSVELIFAITLFLSAALLFGVEPMFAKMILPRLGGSAAVWSVAIAFFQTTLLLGYLYAHILTRYFSFITAAAVHFGVLAIALLSLPIAVSPAFHEPPPGGEDIWLIGLFAASVGLPFFAVSATSPLMQAWFARTGLKNAQNPYVLYGASNVGSFAALLAYPFLIEPALTLRQQSHWWTMGFIALAVLIAGCASGVLRSDHPVARPEGERVDLVHRTTARDRASWTFFAFVPSALMVAVTAHIGTEVVSAPFLWVVPLALYLATFVLVFRTREIAVFPVLVRLQPILTAAAAIFMVTITVPPLISVVLHLAAFFVAAMVCHQALYRCRPVASDLTSFYLYMSLGGALGGVSAALVAPHIFRTVAEYPILLFSALLARPGLFETTGAVWTKEALPILALGAAALAPGLLFGGVGGSARFLVLAALVVLILLIQWQASRPVRVLALTAILFVLVRVYAPGAARAIYVRSFYGVHKVVDTQDGRARVLVHGTTVHGAERLIGDDEVAVSGRPERLTYYYEGGTLDEALSAARTQAGGRLPRVALVGLGVGALACARGQGEDWSVYEIDPELVRLSVRSGLFRTMPICGPDMRIVLGDARLTLAKEKQPFDVIILDTYSSDNVPIHLLTREAMELYRSLLAPRGVIVMNISNHNMELAEVVAASAAAADLKMVSKFDPSQPKFDSTFHATAEVAALARDVSDFGALDPAHGWKPAPTDPGFRTWTDDYSDVLSAILARWL